MVLAMLDAFDGFDTQRKIGVRRITVGVIVIYVVKVSERLIL